MSIILLVFLGNEHEIIPNVTILPPPSAIIQLDLDLSARPIILLQDLTLLLDLTVLFKKHRFESSLFICLIRQSIRIRKRVQYRNQLKYKKGETFSGKTHEPMNWATLIAACLAIRTDWVVIIYMRSPPLRSVDQMNIKYRKETTIHSRNTTRRLIIQVLTIPIDPISGCLTHRE